MNTTPTPGVDLPVIQKSFRCFWFGLAGFVPGFGVAIAWLTLRLFKEIAGAVGEPSRSHFPTALFLAAFAANPFLQLGIGLPATLTLDFLVLGVFGLWSFARFKKARGKLWNPARHLAWVGAGLAKAGLALSFLLLESVYTGAYSGALLGL